MDLPLYDTVKAAGSDRRATNFEEARLKSLIETASLSFRRERIDRDFKDLALDPARLRVVERTPVRVYFVGEASGVQNALGINLTGVGVESGDPRILFPNTTSAIDLHESTRHFVDATGTLNREAFGLRSEGAPLQPGDFVDLGTVSAGTSLEFFLVSPAGSPTLQTYTPHPENNHDGEQHMVAVVFEDSPFLLLSFEDLPNLGDKDFGDCVFALEMSGYNVQALLGRIDPWRRVKQGALIGGVVALLFGTPVGYAGWRRARQRRRARQAHGEAAKLARHDADRALARVDEALHTPLDRDSQRTLVTLKRDILEQAADGASLMAIVQDEPEVVRESERSSILAGRGFLSAEDADGYDGLRDQLREGGAFERRWRELDAEALLVRGRTGEVVASLSGERLDQPDDAGLLARLALACAPESLERAMSIADRAVMLAPQNSETHLARARILEAADRFQEAEHSSARALQLAPRDPAIRLEVGAFFRRHGTYDKAVAIWSSGLRRPSNLDLWLQTLFWRKVAAPVAIDLKGLTPPEGERRPLVDFIRSLRENEFWDAQRFDQIAQARPQLAARQETYWLKLLDCLKRRDEAEALYLLNVQRFGSASWQPDLETALILIASYRTSGFMDPGLLRDADANSGTGGAAFFAQLNQWARGALAEVPAGLRAIVEGASAYATALRTAGWNAAADVFDGR